MSTHKTTPPAGKHQVARPEQADELIPLKQQWLRMPPPEQEAWIQFFCSCRPLSAIRERIHRELNFHLRDDWELVDFGIWVRLVEAANQIRNN